MKEETPRISVVIITFNQENLIGRAIDSVLCQKEYIYEIIISDDCSNDKTWEVIQNYKMEFPTIIKPFKNEPNLGIFGNIESTWSKVTGDIIFLLAGDDTFCDKIFKNTIELVRHNNINYIDDSFLIYYDFVTKFPDGKETLYSNSLVQKHDSISLKIRNLIYNRSMGMSISVLKKHFHVDSSIGVTTEGLIDIQAHMFSDSVYYMPYIGSVYYSNIGVSTNLNRKEHHASYVMYYDILPKMIKSVNKLSNADAKWIRYAKAKFVYKTSPTFPNFVRYLLGLLLNSRFKYGIKFVNREYKAFILNIIRNLAS